MDQLRPRVNRSLSLSMNGGYQTDSKNWKYKIRTYVSISAEFLLLTLQTDAVAMEGKCCKRICVFVFVIPSPPPRLSLLLDIVHLS